MSKILDMMKTTEPNLWHITLGFVVSTCISVTISQLLSQNALIEGEKIQEVRNFVASSQQLDSATREYMRAVVRKSSNQEKLKDSLVGDIQKQYSDLQTARLYLGPNGSLAAKEYRRSLLDLAVSLREANSITEETRFLNELNRTLELRKLVETSLRKSARLPVDNEET